MLRTRWKAQVWLSCNHFGIVGARYSFGRRTGLDTFSSLSTNFCKKLKNSSVMEIHCYVRNDHEVGFYRASKRRRQQSIWTGCFAARRPFSTVEQADTSSSNGLLSASYVQSLKKPTSWSRIAVSLHDAFTPIIMQLYSDQAWPVTLTLLFTITTKNIRHRWGSCHIAASKLSPPKWRHRHGNNLLLITDCNIRSGQPTQKGLYNALSVQCTRVQFEVICHTFHIWLSTTHIKGSLFIN